MIELFRQHISTNLPALLKGKLLLAISGGVDSVALARLCVSLGLDVSLAHCNFHLRENHSVVDQKFVEDLAKQLNVPLFVKEFDTIAYANKQKISIQIAARELRYNWFSELLQTQKMDFVLTAHHLDDSIETFIINLCRATGIQGLSGIPVVNNNIIRPLLCFTRDQIMEFMLANDFAWTEDHTNAQDKYLRNNIRHNIIPLLKDLSANFTESFALTQEHLLQSVSLIQDAQRQAFEKVAIKKDHGIYFDIEKTKQLSNPKAYLFEWLHSYGFTAWNDILHLLEHSSSGKVIPGKGYVLLKDRKYLILKKSSALIFEDTKSYIIQNNTHITEPINLSMQSLDTMEMDSCFEKVYIDADKLTMPLIVRTVQSGDRFIPLGMKGTKKVSKFLKDQKIDLFQKKQTWVVISADQIVWVVGHRLDERFKVTNTTNNIIKLETTV